MSKRFPLSEGESAPLTIEQLEAGLRAMGSNGFDAHAFWDEQVVSFRQTVLFAIRDTSDALLSPSVPQHWRIELEAQLEALVQYIELADRYIACRTLSPKCSLSGSRSQQSSIH